MAYEIFESLYPLALVWLLVMTAVCTFFLNAYANPTKVNQLFR